MNALAARIARLIEVQGPISVAQFMTMALHDPQGGYYATRDPFGARGDFITAPEVSQMFGELLGLWIVQCWQDQGMPSPAQLVELGPGRGTLMADALRAAKLMPKFLAAIEVVLVENSPALRKIQCEKLKDCGAPVRWCDTLDDTLADRPLFLLANEFFDALPIRQFVKTDRGWNERMVTVDSNGALAFALAPVPTAISPLSRGAATNGAIYEISPTATAIAERIAKIIAAKGGAALFVDYGYGDEAAFGETLQAVGGHRFADILDKPGEIDLSAHVDFAALAAAARARHVAALGPISQNELLNGLGITARAQKLAQNNPAETKSLAAAVDRLTNPDQMGTLFKALAFLPNSAPKPAGF